MHSAQLVEIQIIFPWRIKKHSGLNTINTKFCLHYIHGCNLLQSHIYKMTTGALPFETINHHVHLHPTKGHRQDTHLWHSHFLFVQTGERAYGNAYVLDNSQ